MPEFQQLCTGTLEEFNTCMFYSCDREVASFASDFSRPSELSSEMVFKMIALCLMAVAQLQKKGLVFNYPNCV